MASGITGVEQLAKFAKTVRAYDREIGRKIPKGLRELGKPALTAARQAALNIPAKGGRSTGLRRQIAKSLTMSASGGKVTIRVNAKKMPAGKKGLPRKLEGPAPFRHPVFGGDEWVSQRAYPWFGPAMQAHTARIRAGVTKLCEDIVADLERKLGD